MDDDMAPAPYPDDRARTPGEAAPSFETPAPQSWRSLIRRSAPVQSPNSAGLPPSVLHLPQVVGHVHDASCWVQPSRGRLPRDAWGYLVEALWQVCRRADFPEAITALTVLLENRHLRPDAMTAWLWLGTAERMDRSLIAGVANGPEVVAAVRDALRVMATGQATAN